MANSDQQDDDGDGIGDACDPRYCMVVDPSNPNACLDPNAAFAVSAGGSITLKRGEALRLPLFADRNNVGISYSWTVSARPAGSSAAVKTPSAWPASAVTGPTRTPTTWGSPSSPRTRTATTPSSSRRRW